MSISLHDRMLSVAKQLNLPKLYKSDLEDDPRVLNAFEGCSFIWLLRTCGSTLIPLKVGADPCYVTNWLYGSHGQEVHAFLIDEKHLTVEKINFEEAEKLILSPLSKSRLSCPLRLCIRQFPVFWNQEAKGESGEYSRPHQ